jgi:hypothetical protein
MRSAAALLSKADMLAISSFLGPRRIAQLAYGDRPNRVAPGVECQRHEKAAARLGCTNAANLEIIFFVQSASLRLRR